MNNKNESENLCTDSVLFSHIYINKPTEKNQCFSVDSSLCSNENIYILQKEKNSNECNGNFINTEKIISNGNLEINVDDKFINYGTITCSDNIIIKSNRNFTNTGKIISNNTEKNWNEYVFSLLFSGE